MADENPFSQLAVLTTEMLGVLTLMTTELVRSSAVDKDRLLTNLEELWKRDLLKVQAESERRLTVAFREVIRAAVEEGSKGGRDGADS